MSTAVKFFSSAHPNAPTLTGAAGSLISVLDACLISGYGLASPTSVSVAGGVATVTYPAGHSFEPDMVALIAGATPGALNGEKKVITTTTNTITFDATGIPDQVATGTITVKVAPLGWAQPFAAANKAAYQQIEPASSGFLLRIDDSNVGYVLARGYESMTGIDTGTGPFPSLVESECYWPKNSSYISANVAPWFVVGDGRFFYLWCASYPLSTDFKQGFVFSFGDPVKINAADAFACLITGFENSSLLTYSGEIASQVAYMTGAGSQSVKKFWARGFSGIGSATHMSEGLPGAEWQGIPGNLPSAEAYPNPVDNSVAVSMSFAYDATARGRRGIMPGMYVPVQYLAAASPFWTGDRLTDVAGLTGKTLMAVRRGPPGSTSGAGALFFDVTGPWR